MFRLRKEIALIAWSGSYRNSKDDRWSPEALGVDSAVEVFGSLFTGRLPRSFQISLNRTDVQRMLTSPDTWVTRLVFSTFSVLGIASGVAILTMGAILSVSWRI